MIQLTNSEYHFSYYGNLYSSKAPEGEFDINELIEVIKYGYLKDVITKLRVTKDKEAYNKIKQAELPAVTLSGIFKERNSKGLQDHSGLIQIDIDHVKNYDDVLKKVITDPHTYVAFRSPGGKGIKVIVKINPDEATHLEQFYALEQLYKNEFDIEIDTAVKDIARCMLLSYDPDIYCNPFSDVFAELYMPPPPVEPPVVNESQGTYHTTVIGTGIDNEELIERITKEAENNRVDLTDTYEKWFHLGYALSTELGERGRDYFHRLSAFHPDYDTQKCDKQYDHLNSRNNGAITIGTIIYYAREHGIDIKYSDSKPSLSKPDNSTEVETNERVSLFDLLKAKRLEIAKELKVPAYTIFDNKTLELIAEKKPVNTQEFFDLKGIGKKRTEKHSDQFLPIVRAHLGLETKDYDRNLPIVKEQRATLSQLSKTDQQLYDSLRKLRLNISRDKGMRPYWVFTNSVLNEIISSKPKTLEELQSIKGIGKKKTELFGKSILFEIERLSANES